MNIQGGINREKNLVRKIEEQTQESKEEEKKNKMKTGKQQQQHIEMEDEEIQMDDNLEEETSPSQVGKELY